MKVLYTSTVDNEPWQDPETEQTWFLAKYRLEQFDPANSENDAILMRGLFAESDARYVYVMLSSDQAITRGIYLIGQRRYEKVIGGLYIVVAKIEKSVLEFHPQSSVDRATTEVRRAFAKALS